MSCSRDIVKVRSITEIGGLIQQRRTDLGLTQAQAAQRANVSRDWIISIENGRRLTVDFERLLRTLDVLDLSIEITTVAPEDQSDADRAVLERLSRAQAIDFGRTRDETADSTSTAEVRKRIEGLIDPEAVMSDETREALLTALRTAEPAPSEQAPNGHS